MVCFLCSCNIYEVACNVHIRDRGLHLQFAYNLVSEFHACNLYAWWALWRRNVMMKAANKKKPAVKKVMKEPAVKKKPAVNRKKPAINQMATCYCTIAEAHRDGNHSTKQNPTMLVQFRGKNAWLVGELAYSGTCIGGSGRIIKHKAGGLTICRTGNHDLMARQAGHNYIATESNGKEYGGFISAKVTSIAHGTSFQARKIDPGVDCPRDFGSTKGAVAHPRTVVTRDGDIICTFKVKGFHQHGKRHGVTDHLMRPMLITRNIQHSLQTQDTLSDTICEMDRFLQNGSICPRQISRSFG